MGLFSFLFGKKNNNIQTYLDQNAVILDVRTQNEYDANHIDNAIHIPVSELKRRIEEIKTLNKPVIAHCASGIRSAQAVQILKANGIEAMNGGGISAMRKALE
ncbi:rhodanese-related sulfurtransferase [Winogradskyella wandonensis]|uniref:Rhodanese-related sulfurtransferase n=1 Tax=Winogradskyella wandonensis TaxID=1442586 RepID=A0A4R1KKB8_9FLAO|nr:rhodanese-like domain-containing protein [Winogradskyella wandonensis]TCK65226.1 rhodanese-related sulfurtransferase [Winogradskyella wandonensis]